LCYNYQIIKHKHTIIFVVALIGVGAVLFFIRTNKPHVPGKATNVVQSIPTPSPKIDIPFGTYTPPHIPKKEVSGIFMVGDSMTEVLGPHGGKLNEYINTLYQSTPGHQRIVIDNYAKGSTNLLGLQDVMKQKLVVGDAVLDPLLSRKFDLILVESYGYNPLSQLGIEGGIKKQTELLDQLMWTLTETHPNSVIVFVATIAPNRANYSLKVNPNTTVAQRTEQANERIAYIKNHIEYAKSHKIPLINIFEKSLTEQGDGNLTYINPNDSIHPSFAGVDFVSHEIANFIYDNQIFPR
jgi:lysophospholipase L1-like esterase